MSKMLQERIGYRFRDGALLKLALTHPSVLNQPSNQRLEFLGDAVLGLIVSRLLYDLFPNEKEGELARRRAALVRGETLARVARDIGLGDALVIGTSELQSNGAQKASTLEDAFEALVGALYLDGGMAAAEALILPRWQELANNVQGATKDAKTALQEWAQARKLEVPVYRILETSGPAHAPLFTIEASIEGHAPQQAIAASKRAAEQQAAALLLSRLAG